MSSALDNDYSAGWAATKGSDDTYKSGQRSRQQSGSAVSLRPILLSYVYVGNPKRENLLTLSENYSAKNAAGKESAVIGEPRSALPVLTRVPNVL
jgi:hypothetical protein